jgi:hypothetical protein
VTVKAIQGACLVYNLVMGYDGFSILGKKKWQESLEGSNICDLKMCHRRNERFDKSCRHVCVQIIKRRAVWVGAGAHDWRQRRCFQREKSFLLRRAVTFLVNEWLWWIERSIRTSSKCGGPILITCGCSRNCGSHGTYVVHRGCMVQYCGVRDYKDGKECKTKCQF